jgi:hypothetical protein
MAGDHVYGVSVERTELGYSLADLSWSRANPENGEDEIARIRRVSRLLPDGASDHLLRTAIWFCAECDTSEEFRLGITLRSRGFDPRLPGDD